jgi:hypothetical protein
MLAIAGAAARLEVYLHRASYWNDEAAIVVNVMRRGWRELFGKAGGDGCVAALRGTDQAGIR